jgi:hypothetical protein
MAVSKEELAQYVSELGLPQEQTDQLVTTLMGNAAAATQFVGQRMRHADYTKKTQELATQRQTLEQGANQQIHQYAQQLAEAQNRITSIMTDLEKEQISSATANARLRKVKETYNLSDQDIPAIEVPNPAGSAAKNQPVDLDKRFDDFRNGLLSTIRQDMLAMPRINTIMSDISAEHQELTGKRLSRTEMNELLDKAEKQKMRLEDAWRDQYKVDDLRTAKRDEANKAQWRKEFEEEQRKRASDDAMAGVRRVDPTRDQMQSPILKHQFELNQDPGRAQTGQVPTPQTQTQNGPKVSGAERAAAKFLERRSNGIPLGAPVTANQ